MKALIPALGPDSDGGREPDVSIREPVAEDGAAISDLIARCPPLDRNSVYSTLLLCTHFKGTCALAEREGQLIAWVSAYVPPRQTNTLFVWQVAVAPETRGRGLAWQLIAHILMRATCVGVRQLRTTITVENESSWRLFRGVAEKFGASIEAAPHFLRGRHFGGAHETEHLVTIQPIAVSG